MMIRRIVLVIFAVALSVCHGLQVELPSNGLATSKSLNIPPGPPYPFFVLPGTDLSQIFRKSVIATLTRACNEQTTGSAASTRIHSDLVGRLGGNWQVIVAEGNVYVQDSVRVAGTTIVANCNSRAYVVYQTAP